MLAFIAIAIVIAISQQPEPPSPEPIIEKPENIVSAFKQEKFVFMKQDDVEPITKKTFRKNVFTETVTKTTSVSEKLSEKNSCNLNDSLEILFKHDSTVIAGGYQRFITDSVKQASQCGVKKVHIHGYASPDGQYNYNIRLAKRRALAVSNFIKSLDSGLQIFVYNPKDGEEITERKAIVSFD